MIMHHNYWDTRLDITGKTWFMCIFDGCILECHKSATPTYISGCSFNQCQLIGDGWPDYIIQAQNKAA